MDLYLDVAKAHAEANIQEKPMTRGERISLAITFVVIFAGIMSIAIVIASLQRPEAGSAVDPNSPGYIGSSLPEDVGIHSRQEWGSHPPRFKQILNHPTPLVVISDTVTEPCNNFWSCSETVKNIQDRHMEHSLSDIGYNFLVGGDGSVYEGRGWDAINMHTGSVRNCNIAISFIGTFEKDHPPKDQVTGALQLLSLGVHLGKISTNYKVLAVNQTAPIMNPGPLLFTVIKQWVHYWTETKHDKGHFHLWQ